MLSGRTCFCMSSAETANPAAARQNRHSGKSATLTICIFLPGKNNPSIYNSHILLLLSQNGTPRLKPWYSAQSDKIWLKYTVIQRLPYQNTLVRETYHS